MNPLITSADQLTWTSEGTEERGANLVAVIDDANTIEIYIDIFEGEVRVVMDRVVDDGDMYFTSWDPADWTDIEAALPRMLWPAQVWAGSKWARKERPHYPEIDAAIAAVIDAYEAAREDNCK